MDPTTQQENQESFKLPTQGTSTQGTTGQSIPVQSVLSQTHELPPLLSSQTQSSLPAPNLLAPQNPPQNPPQEKSGKKILLTWIGIFAVVVVLSSILVSSMKTSKVYKTPQSPTIAVVTPQKTQQEETQVVPLPTEKIPSAPSQETPSIKETPETLPLTKTEESNTSTPEPIESRQEQISPETSQPQSEKASLQKSLESIIALKPPLPITQEIPSQKVPSEIFQEKTVDIPQEKTAKTEIKTSVEKKSAPPIEPGAQPFVQTEKQAPRKHVSQTSQLHGAYIQGNTGPHVAAYATGLAIVNVLYYIRRKKRFRNYS